MVEISTTHFYSDKEYTFPKGFHLLLEAWDTGIRPRPVCLFTTLGCTLKNSRPLDPERREKQTSQAGGSQALSPATSRAGPTFRKYPNPNPYPKYTALPAERAHSTAHALHRVPAWPKTTFAV